MQNGFVVYKPQQLNTNTNKMIWYFFCIYLVQQVVRCKTIFLFVFLCVFYFSFFGGGGSKLCEKFWDMDEFVWFDGGDKECYFYQWGGGQHNLKDALFSVVFGKGGGRNLNYLNKVRVRGSGISVRINFTLRGPLHCINPGQKHSFQYIYTSIHVSNNHHS